MSLDASEWTEEELEEMRRCRELVAAAWDEVFPEWVDSWCRTVAEGEYMGTVNGLTEEDS